MNDHVYHWGDQKEMLARFDQEIHNAVEVCCVACGDHGIEAVTVALSDAGDFQPQFTGNGVQAREWLLNRAGEGFSVAFRVLKKDQKAFVWLAGWEMADVPPFPDDFENIQKYFPTGPLMLLLPEKSDEERLQVAQAWTRQGKTVRPLGRFWEPPPLDRSNIRVYGNDTFCLVLAQIIGLELVSPAHDFLATVDRKWLKRRVWMARLQDLEDEDFPLFVKSTIPKLFHSAVYETMIELQKECSGMEADTSIICSEPVVFAAEARAFILNRSPVTFAIYEGEASLEELEQVLQPFTWENALPETCTADFGYISGQGWVLIELNPTWGAGLNGCDPAAVSQCLEHASYPKMEP